MRLMISQFGILFFLVMLMTNLFEHLPSHLCLLFHCYLDMKICLRNNIQLLIPFYLNEMYKELRTTLNCHIKYIY